MLTIGIIGSRRRNESTDKELIRNKLLEYIGKYNDITICSGGCPKGGDKFAEEFTDEYGLKKNIHYPNKNNLDKNILKTNPKYAYAKINYDRNTLIAKDSDILIACVSKDRTGGTEDTIKKFIKFKKSDRNLIIV